MSDVYVAESGIHGVGVFAARDFAAGETLMALDDSRVVDAEHPLLNEWFVEEHTEEVGALRRLSEGGARASED